MKPLTIFEHREVRVVHGEQMEVRRELGHQLNKGVVELLIGPTEPMGECASFGWSQKELERTKMQTEYKDQG